MHRFQEIARNYTEGATLNFVYVGPAGARRAAVLEAAANLGCFVKRDAIDLNELRNDSKNRVPRKDFYSCQFQESLIAAWDLTDLRKEMGLAAALQTLPVGALGPQMIGFGLLEGETYLSFPEFIDGINHRFVVMGDMKQCFDAITRWCLGAGEAGSNLRLNTLKNPSGWIREISHDYGNTVALETRRQIEEIGLWDLQRAIDFWQDTVRNVLVFPTQNSPSRRHKAIDLDSELEVVQRIYRTRIRIIGNEGVAAVIHECGLDFSVYADSAGASELTKSMEESGYCSVVVLAPSHETDDATALGYNAPTVIAGDAELRLKWESWPKLLSQNVLGSFSMATFSDADKAKPLPLIKAKDYWRPFCILPVRAAVDQIIDMMIRTYEGLEAKPDLPKKKETLTSIFQCLAQVWYARALYFGSFPTGSRGHIL